MKKEYRNHSHYKEVESLTEELLSCYEGINFIYESGDILGSFSRGENKEWKRVASTILDSALEALEANIGWIYFLDERDGTLNMEEVRGIDAAKAESFSSSLISKKDLGVTVFNNIKDSNAESGKDDPAVLLIAPFKSREKFLGAIAVGRSRGVNFLSHHIKLVSHISSYCAQVFDNARMFQEINEAYQLTIKANEKLQKLNEMKQSFLALTSHELKTPLSIFKICLDLLESKKMGEVTDEQMDVVKEMKRGMERLERVVRSVCQISRIEEGRFSLNRQRFSFIDLMGQVLEDISFIIKDRRIKLQTDVPLELEMSADFGMLKELLIELILNAIKNTPDGGCIKVRGEAGPSGVVVEVRDSGTGVPDEEKERIFDTFCEARNYMNHTSGIYEYKGGGLGVGLAIAKGIVEAHKGKIWIEDPPSEGKDDAEKRGSSFFFLIPDTEMDKDDHMKSQIGPALTH